MNTKNIDPYQVLSLALVELTYALRLRPPIKKQTKKTKRPELYTGPDKLFMNNATVEKNVKMDTVVNSNSPRVILIAGYR